MAASPWRNRRSKVPSSRRKVASRKSAAPRAALAYFGVPSIAAALANAEIISPFQAVRILSSRCGRGRFARASNKIRFGSIVFEVFESRSLKEDVPAGELMVRIV